MNTPQIPPVERPLEGLTAIEIGHSVAAPFGGHVLASLGANLIKVESPGKGDDARGWGPPFWHGASSCFQSLNRDKQSVVVDLKDEAQRDALRALILDKADIVFQNLRPGLIDKFGLDAKSLRAAKPSLIYANMGAFGAVGPMKEKPGYDPLMQAFGGIMSITGEDGAAPVRVGPSLVDIGTGMWTVIGILSALRRRELTGEGCEIDTSLLETTMAWMTIPSALYLSSGEPQGRSGSEAAMVVPYKAYKTADDYMIIAAGNDNLFRRLCGALEKPEWADDDRFRTNADRIVNRVLINAMIEDVVSRKPRAYWKEVLDKAGVPATPIQSIDQVLAHPQAQAVGMLQQAPDSDMQLMGVPVKFNGARPPFLHSPPELGAHTDAVFPARERK
jgi:crotonobetainyl-CoA:carnitine CoA-transferase CaiB-like acyl-CoA transferase